MDQMDKKIIVGGSKQEFANFTSGLNRTKPILSAALGGVEFQHIPKVDKLSIAFEQQLADASGFVLLPNSSELLGLSLFVDKQFDRAPTKGKDVFVSGMSHPLVKLDSHLRDNGFITKKAEDLYRVVLNGNVYRDLGASVVTNSLSGAGVHHIAQAHALKPEHQTYIDEVNAKGANKRDYGFGPAVFCSAHSKKPKDLAHASECGEMVAKNGWDFIFGGGNLSMMGASSAAAYDNGSKVIGVTVTNFLENELMPDEAGSDKMHRLEVVEDIYTRMTMMFDLSDGLIVLDGGGLGTAQEIFAVLEKKRQYPKEHGHKPVAICNESGLWDGVLGMLEKSGFENGKDFNIVQNVDQAEEIFQEAERNNQTVKDSPIIRDVPLEAVAAVVNHCRV
jgi:uncharacterized protein (TIGR00730 family)